MLRPVVLWALPLLCLVLTSRVSAHRFNWVKALPDCWRDCLRDNGCGSSRCICDSSQSADYLTSAVSCARTDCNADDSALEMTFIFPLQVYCAVKGDDIPERVISSAVDAANPPPATSTIAPKTTSKAEYTKKPETTQKPSSSKAADNDDDEGDKDEPGLTQVFTSTKSMTTTNDEGQTLVVIVPVIVGPDTMKFGSTVTSTLEAESTASSSSSSSSASAGPTTEAAVPSATQVQQQPEAGSSTTSSQGARRTSNSNGSPFENMQAGAGSLDISGMIIGMGAVAGLFLRL